VFPSSWFELAKADYPLWQILGVLPLGTSMDYESASARELGAWNPRVDLAPFLEKWSVPNPDFVVDEVWRGMVAGLGFSGTVGQDVLSFWDQTVKEVYSGDEGRKRLRMALINIMERDGLIRRLFPVAIPEQQIKLFTSSSEATLTLVKGGGHYLNATSPKETEEAILKMVGKYA
jgi:hypothetical protein